MVTHLATCRAKLCSKMNVAPPPLRRYAGVSGPERQERRRELLLQAALELFGTIGYPITTIRGLCEHAGLNERYFYESFRTRESLLFELYEQVANEVTEAAVQAVADAEQDLEARARAGLQAFFRLLTNDVRKARVLSIEVVGVNDQLEHRRRQTLHAFAEFLNQQAFELITPTATPYMDPMLTARALVGATNELLTDWILGNLHHTVDELIEHCTRLFVVGGHSLFRSTPESTGQIRLGRSSASASI